jgi:hypothetical protein
MKPRVVAACLIVTTAGVAMASRQTRDPNAQTTSIASGTGIVSGVVVTDTADPQPVRRATVRLSGAGSTVRVVGTDDRGRFVFDRLPAGRVTLSATKAGFVQAFHGSAQPGRGPGVPVAVADGATADVTIRLLPGAVITGAVTDGRGHPAQGVAVTAVNARSSGGVGPAAVRVVTDDRGVYRIFGLAPGDYLVSALPALSPASAARGGPAGVVTAVTEADLAAARSGAAGAARGPAQPARAVTYAPVFYPGTTDAAAAVTVRVASGAERAGVDLPLAIVALARLSGTLADGNGQPLSSAQVWLVPQSGDQPSQVDALVSSGALTLPRATLSGSTFVFTGVPPGQLTLIARTGSGQRGVAAAEAAAPTLWNVTDLAGDGIDRDNLALRLLPGLTVRGRYVFEPGAIPPVDPATLNLSLVATRPIPGVPSTFRAAVQPDGTFRVLSLAPGTYLVRIDVPASASGVRWMLKSAVASGRDLADQPLAAPADGRELPGVVVTFTDRAAEISGRLVDTSGRPVTRYSIVVFTQDRSLWLPGARRIRVARPATDGSFAFGDLPAGDYAIAAIENAEDVDVSDAEFLSQLLGSAFKVTVAEGQHQRQDFRVGG